MAEIRSDGDAVNYLMKSAGKFPLLTGEQEIQLGRQVQAMMQVLALPESKRPEDWGQTVSQGQKAKTRLIKSNLRLVINIAKKYQNVGLPFEDLIQEGSIGLDRGVEKFDPERGYKASTYPFAWIKQAITRAIANTSRTTSRTIRLPVHIKEQTLKLKQLTREMMKENGSRPSAMSERDRLEQILCGIDRRETYVLGLRYGLDQGEGRSLAEIGQLMGVSREHVRQIEAKAMRSARKVAK